MTDPYAAREKLLDSVRQRIQITLTKFLTEQRHELDKIDTTPTVASLMQEFGKQLIEND
jgi:hypothetical protein